MVGLLDMVLGFERNGVVGISGIVGVTGRGVIGRVAQ